MTQYANTQPAPAALPGATSLLVPLYIYPTAGSSPGILDWGTVASLAPPVRYVVANPSSGPGSTVNSDYTAAIKLARAAGIRVLGYVDTNFNAVSLATVSANIRLWESLYGVTDIFFDQVSALTADLGYYSQACGLAHATPGSVVVLNHGAVPDEHYAALGDILVIFENAYSAWSSFTPPSWLPSYPPSKFAVLVYSASTSGNMATVLADCQSKGIGNAYVESGTAWSSLPSYLAAEAGVAVSLGGGIVTSSAPQTVTGQKTFTGPGTTPSGHWNGSVVTDDLTILPNSAISTSASLFLDNNNGQVWEFFCNNGGGFGVYDKTGAKQPVTIDAGAADLLLHLYSSIVQVDGDLAVGTAGNGLKVKEGSNAKQGTATLASGTVTVSNTSVTSSSRIFLTAQDNNTTGALRVSARTAGTSLTITSSNGADSGVVAYQIFEPS